MPVAERVVMAGNVYPGAGVHEPIGSAVPDYFDRLREVTIFTDQALFRRDLENVTGDVLHLEEGSLYPALHRMERRGWLEAEWGVSDNNRQVKYYRLTRRGREYLQRESSGWTEFANAVFKVLQTT